MPGLIGNTIDRYQIVSQLGEGGMATVYKAFDTRLERYVAIKVITTTQQTSEQFLKRFEREAKALAKLSHPNIVHVHDYGEQDGRPYLVMEFIEGGTLKSLMGSPRAPQDAARMVAPIARALGYAHKLDIVHRDVKPANILLQHNGNPMLSDFGIAKVLETDQPQLTQVGVGIGTPEYMAPEQGQGGKIDKRADIYSLGLVFYELVTGRKPFTADTPMAIVWKQVTEPLPDPRLFVPNLQPAVVNALQKALQKRPDDRFQTMEEFASVLEQIASMPAGGISQETLLRSRPGSGTISPSPSPSSAGQPPTDSFPQPLNRAAPQQTASGAYSPSVQLPQTPLNQPPSQQFYTPEVLPPQEPQAPARKKMSSGCIVGIIIAAILLLAGLCGLILILSDVLPTNLNPSSTPTPTSTPEPTFTTEPTATEMPTDLPTMTPYPSWTPAAQATEVYVSAMQECANSLAISEFYGLPAIYCDDFSSDNGWYTKEYDNEYKTQYNYFQDNTLRWDVTSKKPLMTYEQLPWLQSVDHFAVQMSFKRITGPTNSDAGILFRMDYDNALYYYITISDYNQKYAFFMKQGNNWTTLKDWTYNENIIANEWNSIGIYGFEDWFDLYINGVYIETMQDSTLKSGECGIGMDIYDANEYAVFAFDNVILFEP